MVRGKSKTHGTSLGRTRVIVISLTTLACRTGWGQAGPAEESPAEVAPIAPAAPPEAGSAEGSEQKTEDAQKRRGSAGSDAAGPGGSTPLEDGSPRTEERSESAEGGARRESVDDAESEDADEAAEAAKAEQEAEAAEAEREAASDAVQPPARGLFDGATELPDENERRLEVGVLFGGVVRPSGDERVQYDPGSFVGGYLRPEVRPWLNVTAFVRREWVPVHVRPGGLDTSDSFPADLVQPDIRVSTLGLLVEPTWVFHPRLRAFGILGALWSRISAPAPTWEGFDLVAERSGVETDLVLGAGASFDIIPNWLTLQLRIKHGIVLDHFGRVFEPLQAVRDGSIVYFAPLPRPESVTDATLALGVIL